MRGPIQLAAAILMATGIPAAGQYLPSYQNPPSTPAQNPVVTSPALPVTTQAPAVQVPATIPAQIAKTTAQLATASPDVDRLLAFHESDVKFDVVQLMEVMRDKRHEGWVLTAYPDPKTAQPLIGAGFSLDLPAREHPQRDPLNPHSFLEPSSADLWQAAGLSPERLQIVLGEFHSRLDTLSKYGFRSQMTAMEPEITPEDANALLRIGIIQAAVNAKAYCRYFDGLTASQQMGLTQLVYQMGVNLEEFSTFLGLINRQSMDESGYAVTVRPSADYWHDVQKSLVESQWARLYRERATAVIAMFDPRYAASPAGAERRVSLVLRPARRHGRGASGGTLRRAGLKRGSTTAAHKKTARKRRD
jgi:GH24 family phage-related lysozyme (muramidase)